MAMSDWVGERLDRWATGRISGRASSAGDYGGCVLGREYQGGGNREASAPITVFDDECKRTDHAVAQLDAYYQRCVAEYYLNGTAAVLDRLEISKSRFSQIMTKIHILLADMFIMERERKHF